MANFTKEQVLDAFKQRASTRSYDTTRKISDEDFHAILEFGRLSPSSVGSEPWKFVVLQNPELRAKIAPFAWGIKHPMEEMSHLVVILARKGLRYDSAYFKKQFAKRGFTPEQEAKSMAVYKKFQGEDMNVLESERALFDWASKQTYIALANMMTGASMIGVDSCPIEGFSYADVNRILAEEGVFDPEEFGVSVMVTFGYRAGEIKPKSRQSQEEVVSWIK